MRPFLAGFGPAESLFQMQEPILERAGRICPARKAEGEAMTPPPATPATEPSAEAKETALRLDDTRCPHVEYRGVSGRTNIRPRATHCDTCVALALDAYAASRARSYAIEQLEEVAKAQCNGCRAGTPTAASAQGIRFHWSAIGTLCTAWFIQDRIRLLRDRGTRE
jgi:hypothetical protein